ncbi:MAG: hypothetical protein V4642_06500 [Bacteroidota bacterium]
MKNATLLACIFTCFLSGCYTSTDIDESYGSARRLFTIKDAGNDIVYSPDGKYLLSTINEHLDMFGSKDAKDALLWDASNGTLIRDFKLDRRQYLQSACFSPDGKIVAAGGVQHVTDGYLMNTVALWNTATGQLIDQEWMVPFKVTTVSFSPDGQTVAYMGWSDDISFWNISTNRTTKVTVPEKMASYVNTMRYNPDGSYLLLSPQFLMNTKDKSFIDIGRTGRSFSFIPGTDRIMSGGPDGINLLSYITGEYFGTIDDKYTWYMSTSAATKDGKYFAGAHETSTYGAKEINIWRASDGAMITSIPVEQVIVTMDFSPDGSRLAASDKDGNLHVFQITY